ncbi:MAG: MnhB domain-containing protein [Candidatus Omnitrophota bacterium]|nr:MnhB domain-containing protein [Candidatus Omnitrophota bacterium]
MKNRFFLDNQQAGMSLIVKAITRLTVGLILLFGIYIVLHGHLSPGGGFAGGVIIALAFVHLMLAFGKDAAVSKLSKNMAANLEGIGALMFLSVALIGFFGGSFFLNILGKGRPFELFSAGTIPLSNIAISLKVGVGLFAIFLALVILEKSKKEL